MGPHPGRKLIVRSFARKPTRYSEKVQAKLAAEAKPPKPSPAPLKPPIEAADRKLGLSIAKQRKRRRARLAALAYLKTTYPELFNYPPKSLAIGVGKPIVAAALAAGQDNHATRAALHYHVGSFSYLTALAAEGAVRFDLSGKPVEAVSAEHQAEAVRLIAARREATRRAP
jgi:hypothetical protein